jgi:predicted alpha/beta-hydrolase family hydrolase
MLIFIVVLFVYFINRNLVCLKENSYIILIKFITYLDFNYVYLIYAMETSKPIKIEVSDQRIVSGELCVPVNAKAMLVLAHGAGANMKHIFMDRLSAELTKQNIATLRYNFPYMEEKKKRPDVPAVAHATVKAAINKATELYPALPLLAGGKSFGGRMTSQYAAKETPALLKGIIFFGFPLHPAGSPSTKRAAHLSDVKAPMLFLQGTNDALAEKSLIEDVCKNLSRATLVFYEKADHSFKSGKQDLLPDLALQTVKWFNDI